MSQAIEDWAGDDSGDEETSAFARLVDDEYAIQDETKMCKINLRHFERDWPIPRRYERAQLSDGQDGAYRKAVKWAEAMPDLQGDTFKVPNLIVSGDYGTGKTHLCAAICNELRASKYTRIVWTSAVDLIRRIQATYGPDAEESGFGLVEELSRADLLFVDDLDKVKTTVDTSSILLSIFDMRYNAMTPVIITTNATADEMAVRSDQIAAVIDRIGEGATVIRMETRVRKGVEG